MGMRSEVPGVSLFDNAMGMRSEMPGVSLFDNAMGMRSDVPGFQFSESAMNTSLLHRLQSGSGVIGPPVNWKPGTFDRVQTG
jgi:hypothetical protein